jgi:hypothetical protein
MTTPDGSPSHASRPPGSDRMTTRDPMPTEAATGRGLLTGRTPSAVLSRRYRRPNMSTGYNPGVNGPLCRGPLCRWWDSNPAPRSGAPPDCLPDQKTIWSVVPVVGLEPRTAQRCAAWLSPRSENDLVRCAGGGTRTHTSFRTKHFECSASAIPPHRRTTTTLRIP